VNHSNPSAAIENLLAAQQRGFSLRPQIGGFPVLAEALREAGIRFNEWFLPSASCTYVTDLGPVAFQGKPLIEGAAPIAEFNPQALVAAIVADQAGETTFAEFLHAAWRAGVVRYMVDFGARTVTYFGVDGSNHAEAYSAVEL